ncbi:MAG: SPOR domain-containing protein [Pseudomonadaceae bacterium]|nr:SPOR domain-containing protein [Pseudomonadaceae bacterium]
MGDFMTRWLKLSLVALVGCGFVAMVVYALLMRDEIKSAAFEPPLIAAPDTPLKRRPDEPGGMEIPYQDKVVFDLLDRPSNTAVAPLDEEPVIADAGVTVSPEEEEVPAAKPLEEAVAEETVVAPPAVAKVVEAAPVTKPEPKSEAKPEPKPEPKVAAKASGSYGVQLASVSSRADADKAIAKFDANSKLSGLSSRVQTVDVKGKTYYRVQYIGLASRAEADAKCKSLGISCLPVATK